MCAGSKTGITEDLFQADLFWKTITQFALHFNLSNAADLLHSQTANT